ncbi:MAG TPA: helix-turn-helix domain-containing protein [Solirubrobacterales bacterium]|nr:helix-turn-helix domain-containing protein [Solirubrobacterales bacterium]
MSSAAKSTPATPEWRVDPALAPAIEVVLPELGAEILAAIAREVPEYARPLEGSFGRGIRIGVDEALRQFVALVRDPAADRAGGRDVYVGLGRGELRQGRSLDSLQAAYRVGARVAWRLTSEAAARAGHPPERIYELADAIFAYIDELSAESVEGYAAAQSEREGERERRRSQLLAALIDGAPRTEVDRLAGAAGWTVPATLAAAACTADRAAVTARRLGPETLAGTVDERGCLIVADPAGPGSAAALLAAAEVAPLTLGPAGPPEALPASWAEAAQAQALRAAGMLGPKAGLLRAEEHIADLIVAASPDRLELLAARAFAPLADETTASRARLLATLGSWLANMGAIGPTAADLDVHPQTVRYRIARLRELLGDALDDPEGRFELQLALRGRPEA